MSPSSLLVEDIPVLTQLEPSAKEGRHLTVCVFAKHSVDDLSFLPQSSSEARVGYCALTFSGNKINKFTVVTFRFELRTSTGPLCGILSNNSPLSTKSYHHQVLLLHLFIHHTLVPTVLPSPGDEGAHMVYLLCHLHKNAATSQVHDQDQSLPSP